MKDKNLLLTALTLSALPGIKGVAQTTAPEHYNIVFIMSDDHTAQMMSCYDKRYVKTPNLDRIAKDGVLFTNSFVANSLSGPSRACMITGKHSHKNGFTNNVHSSFDGSQQTMPKLLRKAGYETALFGKWHLHTTPTGFDCWNILPGQGSYYNPDFINMDGSKTKEKGYVTNIVTEKSLNWLDKQHQKDKPFALFIHHKACHRDWIPEQKYLTLYEDQVFPLPETFYDDYKTRKAAAAQEMNIYRDMSMSYDLKIFRPGDKDKYSGLYRGILNTMNSQELYNYLAVYDKITDAYYANPPKGKALDFFKFQRYMRDYAKVVKSLDDNIGKVLDYLEQHDLLKNTLVVYTSDQGFYMGEHGWFDKRFMYEESMRTPLIMHLPEGLKARGTINEMVQNIDYAPTFLDLAGAEIPSDIQGVSLLPLLEGKHPKWRKGLYYHFYEYPAEHRVKRHYGVRGERYKLIHFYNDIDEWELFDLQNDPHELNNIYGQPGTEKITKKMKQELWKLQVEYDDPIRTKYPLK